MSAYTIKDRISTIFNPRSKTESLDIWLISLLIGNILLVFAYYFTSFVNYISGALTFSFLLYILLLFVFFNKKNKTILFGKQKKNTEIAFHDNEISAIRLELDRIMREDELYRNANLKSLDVAKKIGLTVHQFSSFLNDVLGKNFALFVNEYRIDHAKKMWNDSHSVTLESIGYESGFNSKSTFFSTFKKLVGTTPAKYSSLN